MSRENVAQVVTANALVEGDVVWLADGGTWTRDFRAARVFADADGARVALGAANRRTDEVVGCYLADVRLTPQGHEPAHFREDFRRKGPSNYAHGKQAQA